MNDYRRLELAKRNISLVNQLKLLKEIYKEEEYAIEEIKSESRKDEAEQGLSRFDDLLDQLEEVCDMFDEVAQGKYSNILDKEQRRQDKVKEEKVKAEKEQLRLEQEKEKLFKAREVVAFMKDNPDYKIPDHDPIWIEYTEEFYYWKYIDDANWKPGDPFIEEHTPAYKKFLETL
jgi:hypothetical protein